jgi:hypothetical protein
MSPKKNKNSSASAKRKTQKEASSGRKLPTAGQVPDTRRPLWRQPLAQIVGAIGVLVTATIVAIGGGLGGRIINLITAPQPPHGPPVRIDSASSLQPWHDDSYVLPYGLLLTPTQLADMNAETARSASAYQSWFREKHGAQANQGYVQVTISSNYSSPVTIREIGVIKNCQKSLNGTLFDNRHGSAEFPIPAIEFNLDQNVSVGQYGSPPGNNRPPPGGNFFAKEEVTVSPHERPQTLSIFASTQFQYCKFTFQMHVVTDRGESVETITNDGQPFQLTAAIGSDYRTTYSHFAIVYADNSFVPPGRFTRLKPK